MNIPRKEHPNPQFVRKDWINLNGRWEFEIDHGATGEERKFFEREHLDSEIIVPFCPESELSSVGYKDFMLCVWYRRDIEVPEEWLGDRVFLRFGAVDYRATVYVNGQKVGTHEGGYTSFAFDITDYLCGGKGSIVVCAYDDTRSPLQPSGKQSVEYYSKRCHYTRTTGIWQTVYLERVPKAHVNGFKVYPNLADGSVFIQANVSGSGKFTAVASIDGKEAGAASAESRGGAVGVCVKLNELKLWGPGNGRLYDLIITYGDDEISSYFGMRDIKLDGFKFLINGKSVFQRLVLDQGFYPDGIYTAPDENALIRDIELSISAGFNGARLHEKIFEPLFLYHCDRLGYIAWGEHANWGVADCSPETLAPFLNEWVESVERDFNHPSIVGWCPFNETWNDSDRKNYENNIKTVYNMTKLLDSTRPCLDSSGGYHVITDIYDLHDYDQNPDSFKKAMDTFAETEVFVSNHLKREWKVFGPSFISEYGGIKWSEEQESWGYGDAPKTLEEFFRRYKGLTDALLDNPKMFGFCYTQLYDVEQECNGIYTYSRENKFDVDFICEVNTRKAAVE